MTGKHTDGAKRRQDLNDWFLTSEGGLLFSALEILVSDYPDRRCESVEGNTVEVVLNWNELETVFLACDWVGIG